MSCDRERRDRQRAARRRWERAVADEAQAERQHREQIAGMLQSHRGSLACRRWV